MKACACAVDWGVQVAMMVRCVGEDGEGMG